METKNDPIRGAKLSINETIALESRRLLQYCKDQQFTLAKELLDAEFIDLELQDEAGCSAFYYACINEDCSMFDLLLYKGS